MHVVLVDSVGRVLDKYFKRQVLQWDGATVHTKEPRSLLRKYHLTKCEMHEVVMKTAEPDSTRESTDRMVKILDITYANAELEQAVSESRHLNSYK